MNGAYKHLGVTKIPGVGFGFVEGAMFVNNPNSILNCFSFLNNCQNFAVMVVFLKLLLTGLCGVWIQRMV